MAHLWVVEFQKRGLPHVHIIIILADADRPKTAEKVDSIVTAELPPNPSEPGISQEEKARRKRLWDIVVTNMIHGPCGDLNKDAQCMDNGKCTKKFPKPFKDITIVDPDHTHPVYQRRSPERGGGYFYNSNGKLITNRWVVPYNVFLTLRYGCHINIEICESATACKYLFKYVTKGPDRAMVSATVPGTDEPQPRNEIRDYEDMRNLGSSEAAHKLFGFPIAENKPPVQALRIHLKDHQHVIFVGGQEENVVERGKETELTAFFKVNAEEKDRLGPDFDPTVLPKYVDMPQTYTLTKMKWKIRQRGFTIGRVHTVNPLAGDVFYLRMLLHHDH